MAGVLFSKMFLARNLFIFARCANNKAVNRYKSVLNKSQPCCITSKYIYSSVWKVIPTSNAHKTLVQSFSISSVSLGKRSKRPCDLSDSSDSDDEAEEVLEDQEHEEFVRKFYKFIPGMGHHVIVILPKIKYGPKKKRNTTPELQLEEAVTLIETLPRWKVIQKAIITCESHEKKYLFASGNLEKVKEMVANPEVTAVFFSHNMLSGLQHSALQELLQKPVYDRYTIVLQIFLDHAKTKEAKLQVALAEIHYLRSRLRGLHNSHEKIHESMRYIGGSGESYIQKRKELLFLRELKLKKEIKKLQSKRCLHRENRIKIGFPTVAVVGYTNAGKTSLIKALTSDERLNPMPQLFATLDVTTHKGILPCQQTVLYTDTVGFITEIPTSLIQSFASTLEDISLAHLLVHVWDASHPDIVLQRETVKTTLESLALPHRLLGTMLHVGNKVDLLESPVNIEEGEFLVSTKDGTGMFELRAEIEKQVLENAGFMVQTVRVPNGGEEFSWLQSWTSIQLFEVDQEDPNFVILRIICTHAMKNKFHHHFNFKMRDPKDCVEE